MRRFVPAAMPLLVLLAALGISAMASMVAKLAGKVPGHAVLAVGAAAMLLFPISTTLPVGGFQPEDHFSAAIEATCRTIGPRAAIVTASGDTLFEQYISALRSWCNVPVAMLTRPLTAAEMKQLSDDWQSEDRTLWVLGSTPALVSASAPGLAPSHLASAKAPKELEMTINRPPSHYAVALLDIYGSRVAP
jgi:hypothetical protein